MSIEAGNSNSVHAECPKCHSPIMHGFQVCSNCGHMVSAKEQAELAKGLRNNDVKFFSITAVVASIIAGITYLYG